ncbi:MAG TPA: twin-arginine translocase TatA/TatE family subunit [Chitinophagaceae bacterium]|nr:twin-arginine translocase TatA/TatE family subunit [Chitinophagaceae bacterium]
MTMANINPQFLLSMPSGGEWGIILLVVIVLFGGKKIPELARGIGKGIREFNDAKEGVKSDIEAGINNKEVEKK